MICPSRRTLAACALGLALVAAPAVAFADQTPARTISIRGHAARDVTPDVVTIAIGVTTRAPKADAALDANSAAAKKVIDYARSAGVTGADIRTRAVTLNETTRSQRDANGIINQVPDGYIATNTVSVRLTDLSKLGPFLREVVDQGANRINGLTFDVAARDKIGEEVRLEAVADAKKTAAALAGAAGASLGQVLTIVYPPDSGYRPMPSARAEFAAAPAPKMAVPIEGGAISIETDVDTTWALQ